MWTKLEKKHWKLPAIVRNLLRDSSFAKKNCVKSTIDTELLKNQSEVDFASKTKNQNLLQLDDNRQYEFKLDRLCIGQAPTSKYLCRKVEIYEQKYY